MVLTCTKAKIESTQRDFCPNWSPSLALDSTQWSQASSFLKKPQSILPCLDHNLQRDTGNRILLSSHPVFET